MKLRIWNIWTAPSKIVEPIMGVAFWKPEVEIKPEVVTLSFKELYACCH